MLEAICIFKCTNRIWVGYNQNIESLEDIMYIVIGELISQTV